MSLHAYLFVSLFVFSLGIVAVLSRRNLITILIGVELMLNAASLNFMAFNKFIAPDPAVGQITTLIIIGLAAAEVSIFLSILMVLYRRQREIDVERLKDLRG